MAGGPSPSSLCVVSGPAAAPRSLVERQTLRPHSGYAQSEPAHEPDGPLIPGGHERLGRGALQVRK